MTRSDHSRLTARGLVALQLMLLAALVVEPPGFWWPRDTLVLTLAAIFALIGLIVAILGIVGLGPALTASPIPKDGAPLVIHGLYGTVRNPIYTGLMTIGVGLVVFGASWWHVGTWVLLVLILAFKARWEERMLADAHPEFQEYAARVGRFFPGIGRLRIESTPGSQQ